MNDEIFRSLAAGYPMHMVWKLSLPHMWDEIENTLGHPARFLTEDQREALR